MDKITATSLVKELYEVPVRDLKTSSYVLKCKGRSPQYFNTVCHAFAASKSASFVEYFIDDIRKYTVGPDTKYRKRYGNYIIQRSPWSHVFMRKNIDTALRYGMRYKVSCRIHDIICGVMALRVGTEYRGVAPLFCQLVDRGYSEHIAFLVTQLLVVCDLNPNHAIFQKDHNIEELAYFFKNGYTRDKNRPAFQHGKMSGNRVGYRVPISRCFLCDLRDRVFRNEYIYKIVKQGNDGWAISNAVVEWHFENIDKEIHDKIMPFFKDL